MSVEKTFRSWDNVLVSIGLIAFGYFCMRGFWRPMVSRDELHFEEEVVQFAPHMERGSKGKSSLAIDVKVDRTYRVSGYALGAMDVGSFLSGVHPGDTLLIGATVERWNTVLSVSDQNREYIDLDAYNAGRHTDSKLGLIIGVAVIFFTLLLWFMRRRIPFLK